MKDWVHGVGQSPVCQILLQIVSRAFIMASPPACTSSVGTLSAPADFPFLSDFTATSSFAKDGVVVVVGCWMDDQYFWVSCGSVVVQLGAVLGPPL